MSPSHHWMMDALQKSDRPGAKDLVIDPEATVPEAWELTRKVCNMGADELSVRIARHFGLGLADLQSVSAPLLKLLPEQVARRHNVLPLRQTNTEFFVATSHPTDLRAEEDIAFASGRTPCFEIAPPQAITDAIQEWYGRGSDELSIEIEEELVSAVELVQDMGPEAVDAVEVEAAPVVRLTNIILRDAVRSRASDVHLEPGRREGTVRFRVDGVMRVHMRMPMQALHRVVSRIKVMSKLDIADRLRPQDGRARLVVEGRAVELRVSTIPTREAEKAVLRVLAQQGSQRLDEIGLMPEDVVALRGLITHRNGIVIVTGPTGSGKTTTLYAVIREVANGEVNVMTVEDPIEYEIPGITQMQVEPRRNVTFASALRAILRQDPDVILVGEIRDLETANVALQASMTGHLVLATLHTNDAASAVARLVDLGVDRPSIAATLRGVLAQRLVRRACPDCRTPIEDELTDAEAKLAARFGVRPTVRANGCVRCGRTGYAGRLPVQEVMVVGGGLTDRIAAGAGAHELRRGAVAGGMRAMLDNALGRVTAGETTLDEVERVLGEPTDAAATAPTTPTSAAEAEPAQRAGAGNERAVATAPGATAAANAFAVPPSGPPLVLVVDDDPVHRGLARRALEQNGFEVEEAASGLAALERIGTGAPFQLVVTDLSMPGLGGREVVSCLRAMPKTARLPIVVATSEENEQLEIELIEAGADDYIRKPIEPTRFVARVRAALRRAAA